jgi:flagellar hook-associated protein 1
MSTLRTAGLIAQSGLTATQAALTVTAANVANADTENYTRKTATRETATVNGSQTGLSVNVTGLARDVDTFLTRQIVSATSASAQADVMTDYLARVEAVHGSVSSSNDSGDIASATTEAGTALASLAAASGDSTSARTSVNALADIAQSLQDASADLQAIRQGADQQLADTVEAANSAIQTIADLNDGIVTAKAAGRSTADLEDQRDAALKSLAGMMDVSYSLDSDGRMQVFTGSGAALVTTRPHPLSFTAATSIDAGTLYSQGDLSGITLNGRDISDSISSGSIRGLLDVRDGVAVDEQARLDNLATALIDTLNSIANQGTSYPAPTALTGTTSLAATDALTGSGVFTLVAVGGDDKVTASLSIDLSTVASVQDLVDTINADGAFAAELTSDGKLRLTAADGSGIAIDQGDSAVAPDGDGLSAYFGLNDIFTGSGASDIRLKPELADDPDLIPAGTVAGTVVGDRALSSGDTSTAAALADAFTESRKFSGAGGLSSRSTSFAGYAGDLAATAARSASSATTKASTTTTTLTDLQSAFASQSGVNLDEETATIQSLETAYQAAARVMSALQTIYDELLNMVK